MKFSVSISGLKELRARVAGMQLRMGNLEPAYMKSGMVALKAAKERIKSQGSGSWPPTAETQSGAPLFRTGRLINSLDMNSQGNVVRLDGDGITVGTNLKTKSGLSIGRILQEGSGIYGPSGAPITPKNSRFLSFVVNGKRVFAMSVKGTPKRRFLYIDEHVASVLKALFAKYIMRGDLSGESD
jgi:hypothetical protein